ncbi:hypothetical protein [Labrys miyagiensis]|uniref:hypothetical protein n=1 Tax=Labrys miyagiensis TaxID=346912 RepID=UPI0024E06049|nr:hypothetical protein [Labrys miyagiensis]
MRISPAPFAALKPLRRRLACGKAGQLVLALVISASVLTSARPAWAICEPQEGQRLTLDAAHRFMQNPTFLLRQQMSSYSLSVFIMQYAATHSRDLDVLKLILPRADKKQQAAIGLGLARAVTVCRTADGSIAERVDKWASRLPMHDLLDAYRQTLMLDDPPDATGPTDLASPAVENRVGDGLTLFHPPSADGVGSFDIPDPTRLPGDD